MMRVKYIFALILLIGSLNDVIGQYAGAVIKLEKDAIRIGDQITAEFNVTFPSGSRVQWPMFLDTLTRNVEILRKSGIDTVSSDKNQFTLKQELVITSFDSGAYVIHPVIFKYNRGKDTLTFFTETLPVRLDVQNIQTDPSKDIKPIKPPLKVPVTFREILPWIGIFLLIVVIAGLIYSFIKKKKIQPPLVTTRLSQAVPPYEAAMDALESLRQKKLWQSGRVKEYYSELTEIVREYIELRYSIRALEMTTEEIYPAVRALDISSAAGDKLNQVLVLADLVKFAKEQPQPLENEQSLNQSVEFVRETRPRKEEGTVAGQQNEHVEQQIEK